MHSMHDVALVFGRRAAALTLSAMLLFVSTLAPSAALAQSAPAVTRPIVNVLCQFGDEPDRQGATPAGVQSLYDRSSGLTSYLREQSNGSLSVVASTLAWFVLPSSRASYMPHNSVPVDQASLAAGCTAAAGPSLSMTPDTILVLWFNDDSIGSYTNAALSPRRRRLDSRQSQDHPAASGQAHSAHAARCI